jgi:hypothetical protein
MISSIATVALNSGLRRTGSWAAALGGIPLRAVNQWVTLSMALSLAEEGAAGG